MFGYTYIIVPAFNEAGKIGRVVRGLFEHGFDRVVVVDDGSSDDTAAVAKEAGAAVLIHRVNRGQGAALQTGNVYALRQGAEAVVHFDGDDQFSPEDVLGAVEFMRLKKIDMVLGSRFLDDRSRVPFLKRWLLLPLGRMVNRVLTGVALSDAHNGFRVLSRRALSTMELSHDRMAHASEYVAEIKKKKLLFAEYPVRVTYHEYGQGFQGGLVAVFEFIFGQWLFRK